MLLTSYLADFVKSNKTLSSTNTVLMLSLPLNDIVLPHLYSKFLSAVQASDRVLISRYSVLIIIVFGIIQALSVLYDWYDANITPKFQGHMTLCMVRQILDKYDTEYKDITAGSLIARFARIPELLNNWFGAFKDYILPYAVTFTGVGVYFSYYDPVLGGMFFLTLSLILYNILLAFKTCKQVTKCSTEDQSALYEEVEDIINNILTIYSVDRKEEEIKRLDAIKKEFEKHYRESVLCGMKLKTSSFMILTAFFVFLIYRVVYLVRIKKLEVSTTVALFMMFTSILNGMVWTIDIVRDMIRDWTVMLETEGFLEQENPPIQIPAISLPTPPYSTGIGMWNVSFSYPNTERLVLKNITFHINRGERVVITGENGMGKSTVLKLLLQLYAPSSGGIYIDGKWYQEQDKKTLRKKIGYIPQNTMLFNRSILENIQYGNEGVSREQIESIISELGLTSEIKNLDKMVGKHGHGLSGGQRQLVWMLRIMIRNPEYIILDEPTNSLDQQTKELLIRMLDRISPSQTVIAISHDPFLIDYFKRAIRIHNGYVTENN